MTSVLVVDDSPVARRRAREPLEENGYTVLEAEDGADAMARVEEAQPDAILLNVEMPETEVFEVMDHLAARGLEIPVVVATAHDDEETVRGFFERGAVDFLAKDPFFGVRVLNAIHRGLVLARHPEVQVTEEEPGRVLVLDDSPLIRRFVHNALEEGQMPLVVEEAEDAEQALELTRERGFDVLLVDHVLPGMDGAEFLERLRADGIATPAMALTGQRDPELAERFLEAGAYGVWTKEHEGPLRLRSTVEKLVRLNRVEAGPPPPPTQPV